MFYFIVRKAREASFRLSEEERGSIRSLGGLLLAGLQEAVDGFQSLYEWRVAVVVEGIPAIRHEIVQVFYERRREGKRKRERGREEK